MLGHLFTIAAAICFLLFLLGLLAVNSWLNPGVHWDRQASQWLSDPPPSKLERYLTIALTPLTAVAPVLWLRRFLIVQRRRNRAWRGRCWSCGYDLRGSTSRCPECGTPVSEAYRYRSSPSQRIAPGTKATLLMLATVSVGLVVIYLLMLFVVFTFIGVDI